METRDILVTVVLLLMRSLIILQELQLHQQVNCILQINTTSAGNGNYIYPGDGALAINSGLEGPTGVALSPNDDVYIAQQYGNRVYVVIADGTITTFAGNGLFGYSGDNIPAKSSKLYYPFGITVSSSFEVYISDTDNNLVRKAMGYFTCNGIYNIFKSACSGNGNCQSPNNCTCVDGHSGYDCQLHSCNGVESTDIGVCSGRGACMAPNNCHCSLGYTGSNCELSICYGIYQNDLNVCSGHGACSGPNTCNCSSGFTGTYCQQSIEANIAFTIMINCLLFAFVFVLFII